MVWGHKNEYKDNLVYIFKKPIVIFDTTSEKML